jgi:hypothetical protein
VFSVCVNVITKGSAFSAGEKAKISLEKKAVIQRASKTLSIAGLLTQNRERVGANAVLFLLLLIDKLVTSCYSLYFNSHRLPTTSIMYSTSRLGCRLLPP